MPIQLASLYEIVLGAHRISAYLLVLFALTLAVLSILSRHQEGLLGQAAPLIKLSGPLLALVVLTGSYQLIDLGMKFFQGWIVGALLLGIAMLGVMHAYWWPRAKKADGGEPRALLIPAALTILVLIFAATYLMQSH
jgi:MFS superfamily sulfate permease-like transporter